LWNGMWSVDAVWISSLSGYLVCSQQISRRLTSSHRHTTDGAKCAEKCGKPRKSCGHACQLKWYLTLLLPKLMLVTLPLHAMNPPPVKPTSQSAATAVSTNKKFPVSQLPLTLPAVSKTSPAQTSAPAPNVIANSRKHSTSTPLPPSTNPKTSRVGINFEHWSISPIIERGVWRSRRFSATFYVGRG